MTETVPPPTFVTQVSRPSGIIAMPLGLFPTATFLIKVWVAVSMTETESPK